MSASVYSGLSSALYHTTREPLRAPFGSVGARVDYPDHHPPHPSTVDFESGIPTWGPVNRGNRVLAEHRLDGHGDAVMNPWIPSPLTLPSFRRSPEDGCDWTKLALFFSYLNPMQLVR